MRAEILEGYVVDIACLRKFPRDELADRARQHSRECGMMGHCVESGFGLVDSENGGRVALLDPEATSQVLEVLKKTERDVGIRLRAERRRGEDGSMETRRIELIE